MSLLKQHLARYLRCGGEKMIKTFLMSTGVVKDEEEFKEVMEATTAVIKVDRTSQGKKTSIQDVFEIAVNATIALRRCTQYIR